MKKHKEYRNGRFSPETKSHLYAWANRVSRDNHEAFMLSSNIMDFCRDNMYDPIAQSATWPEIRDLMEAE